MHDRFIVLDYGEKNERIFHCGASSKDAAVKLTTAISELMSGVFEGINEKLLTGVLLRDKHLRAEQIVVVLSTAVKPFM